MKIMFSNQDTVWGNNSSRPRNAVRFVLLALACLQFACSTAPAASTNSELFEVIEALTGDAEDQTVVPGFFRGGATAEIIVLSAHENRKRTLELYGLDSGNWVSILDADFSPNVLFVDVANIGGRDRLITYERGRISWIDPESGKAMHLIDINANYNAAGNKKGSAFIPGGEIPHVDITRDLNHDGRDDLIIPDFDGFRIATQLADGSFTDPVKLGPAEPLLDLPVLDQERSYRSMGISAGTIPVYLSRVHEMDHDQDGRSDLVFWNTDHFDVYHQKENGSFDPDAVAFSVDVPFDSEGIYSRVSDFDSEGVISLLLGLNESSSRTVLHSFRDLNGDKVADMLTLTLSGRTMLRQKSVYQVHLGRAKSDGISFAVHADAAISPKGKAGAMQPWGYSSQLFQDFDSDGQLDVMFRDVRVGFGGMARALVGNSVPIDLEFYWLQDGVYADKPATKRSIRRFRPLAGVGNVFLPSVMLGDVNGDGRSDLLVGQSPEELQVFLGMVGPDLFARKPHKIAVSLPSDERKTRLIHLNRDNRQDVIIIDGPTEQSPDKQRRFATLIAN